MKKMMLTVWMLASGLLLSGESVTQMPQLQNPQTIIVDEGQILIAEFPVIYVYDLDSKKFLFKFGKAGEGPQEFFRYTRIQLDPMQPEYILINSHLKVSYFTRTGKFVKEIRNRGETGLNVMKPVGDNFVAYGAFRDEDQKRNYQTINLLGSDLKTIKTIYQQEQFFNPDRRVVHALGTWDAWFRIYKKRIFITGEKDSLVLVYDSNGNHLFDIEHEYEKLPVTDSDKERFHDYFRTNPQWKQFYDQMKTWIKFPSYFPAIKGMDVTDDRVYVNGHIRPDGSTGFTIFDLDGNLLKDQVFLKLPEVSARDLYPYTIRYGRLYQLAENVDQEIWELHVHDLLNAQGPVPVNQ